MNAPAGLRKAAQVAVHNFQAQDTGRRHRRGANGANAAAHTGESPQRSLSPLPTLHLPPSDYVPGSDEWFREHVPQKTRYAHLVGFASHTVVLELRKAVSVVGRRTPTFRPELDLSAVVRTPKKVSHSHVTIEWDCVTCSFRARVLSSNGSVIDGRLYREGVVQLGNGSVVRVQNFEMTLVIAHDMIPPK